MTHEGFKIDANSFAKEDLEEALRAIDSLIDKCEKAQEKIIHRSSQRTLLIKRLKALNIASSLINSELQKNQNNGLSKF